MNYPYNIGDGVIAVTELLSQLPKGSKGIIVNFKNSFVIGVEWESLTYGHDCGGYAKFGKGFYVRPDEIKLECETIFVVNESGEYNIQEVAL